MSDVLSVLGKSRIAWVFLALGLMFQGCAASRTADGGSGRKVDPTSLVLRKADGVVVEVPRSGALADERALALAQAISDFDAKRASGDPFEKIGESGLRDAVAALARDLRDDAVDQLDLTYRVARRTSSGLDGGLLAQGQESMKNVTELLTRPPTKLYVSTQITSRIEDVSIQYISASDYRKQSDDWMGYTFGQSMKIGVYVFRVQRHAGAGEPLFQKLEIMADPLVRTLDPAGRL